MKQFIGKFKDINNKEGAVYITCSNAEGDTENLTLLADEPILIEYKGGGEYFKPYLCSTATIKIVTDKPLFELNDVRGDGVKVNITFDGKTIWRGYATPNAYTQNYDYSINVYELECQDALSTLANREYKQTELFNKKTSSTFEEGTDTNPSVNLLYILTNILKTYLSKTYVNIYFTNALEIPQAKNLSLLEALYLSERNFFDEDGKPWNCLQVIEEICRILGVTCVPYGYNLYFINYEAIAREINTYHTYSNVLQNYRYRGVKTLESAININPENLRGGGVQISLTEVYNSVKVKADLYNQNSLISNYKDNSNLVASSYIGSERDTRAKNKDGGMLFEHTRVNGDKTDKSLIFLRFFGFDRSKDIGKQFRFYHYPKDRGSDGNIRDYEKLGYGYDDYNGKRRIANLINVQNAPEIEEQNKYSYDTAKDYIGACLVDYAVQKVEEFDDTENLNTKRAIYLYFDTLDDVGKLYVHSRKFNYETDVYSPDWCKKNENKQKLFSVSTDYSFIHSTQAIEIQGAIKFFENHELLPLTYNTEKAITYGNRIVAELSVNGYYWNGERWQDEPTNFYLTLDTQEEKNAFGTDYKFKSVHNNIGGFKSGNYCAPLHTLFGAFRSIGKEDAINGKIIFSIYRPHGVTRNVARSAIISDFDISVIGRDEDNNSNLEYSNTIKENALTEYSQITCKISSNNDKGICLSNMYYLDKMKTRQGAFEDIEPHFITPDNVAGSERIEMKNLLSGRAEFNRLRYKQLKLINDKGSGNYLRPEQHIISRICNQHYTPTLKIDTTISMQANILPYSKFTYLSQFEGFDFTLHEMSFDVANASAKISIINRKKYL